MEETLTHLLALATELLNVTENYHKRVEMEHKNKMFLLLSAKQIDYHRITLVNRIKVKQKILVLLSQVYEFYSSMILIVQKMYDESETIVVTKGIGGEKQQSMLVDTGQFAPLKDFRDGAMGCKESKFQIPMITMNKMDEKKGNKMKKTTLDVTNNEMKGITQRVNIIEKMKAEEEIKIKEEIKEALNKTNILCGCETFEEITKNQIQKELVKSKNKLENRHLQFKMAGSLIRESIENEETNNLIWLVKKFEIKIYGNSI